MCPRWLQAVRPTNRSRHKSSCATICISHWSRGPSLSKTSDQHGGNPKHFECHYSTAAEAFTPILWIRKLGCRTGWTCCSAAVGSSWGRGTTTEMPPGWESVTRWAPILPSSFSPWAGSGRDGQAAWVAVRPWEYHQGRTKRKREKRHQVKKISVSYHF